MTKRRQKRMQMAPVKFDVVKVDGGWKIKCMIAGSVNTRPRDDGTPFGSEAEALASWRKAEREIGRSLIEQYGADALMLGANIDLSEPVDCQHDKHQVIDGDGKRLWCMDCGKLAGTKDETDATKS